MAETKDAVALLKADHRKVEELFAKYENSNGDKTKQKIALEICRELTVHSILEEEIFYPACLGSVDEEDIKEGYVEHDAAKVLIAEIEAGDPSDEFFDSKVKVLKEEIEHHVEEEEEGKDSIFGQAKKAGVDLEDIGRKMIERKRELMKDIREDGLPEPELQTFERTEI